MSFITKNYRLRTPISRRRHPITVGILGLGPIGLATSRRLLADPRFEIVGAVDVDPEKVGRPLTDLVEGAMGVSIVDSVDALGIKPEVMIHTTSSYLGRVHEQIRTALKAGCHVVSSSEELFYPASRNTRILRELDDVARECERSVVATGVNPGFVMDVLPGVMSRMVVDLKSIQVRRRLDAGARRRPLRKKVGIGLEEADFCALAELGDLGHVGLMESLLFLSDVTGMMIDTVEDAIEPVLAESPVAIGEDEIPAGRVLGIHQVTRGLRGGRVVLELDLVMAAGVTDPVDVIKIDADPPVRVEILGGLPGDQATPAALVTTVPRILGAPPGVVTMADLPLGLEYMRATDDRLM